MDKPQVKRRFELFLPDSLQSEKDKIIFKLHISKTGVLTKIEKVKSKKSELYSFFTSEIEKWEFYPAIKKGIPIDSYIKVIVDVNPKKYPYYFYIEW